MKNCKLHSPKSTVASHVHSTMHVPQLMVSPLSLQDQLQYCTALKLFCSVSQVLMAMDYKQLSFAFHRIFQQLLITVSVTILCIHDTVRFITRARDLCTLACDLLVSLAHWGNIIQVLVLHLIWREFRTNTIHHHFPIPLSSKDHPFSNYY